MHHLTYTEANGLVQPTALVTFRGGDQSHICNSWDELVAAMDAGKPFVAHAVRGMQPQELVINPPHVVTVYKFQG